MPTTDTVKPGEAKWFRSEWVRAVTIGRAKALISRMWDNTWKTPVIESGTIKATDARQFFADAAECIRLIEIDYAKLPAGEREGG